MKLVCLLLCFSSVVLAQTPTPQIKYTYDNRGNRITRDFVISAFRVGNKDSTESAKEFTKIAMQEGISVFPNPTKDKVVLTINDFDPSETNSMSLLDSKGNEIISQKVTQSNSQMDVSKLEAGIYYFKVIKNENMLYYKLVKID